MLLPLERFAILSALREAAEKLLETLPETQREQVEAVHRWPQYFKAAAANAPKADVVGV